MHVNDSSAHSALRLGAREAIGVPGAVLMAGYVGYGAFAADSQFTWWAAVLSTMVVWALPGQLVLLEMSSFGAPAFAIVTAVMLTATRFLPMTVSLLPILRAPRQHPALHFVAAHLLAMTGWAVAMRRAPELPVEQRLPYFLGFTMTCWGLSMLATAAGFLTAGALNPLLKIGFVFLNPVYFMIVLAGDIRGRMMALSLAAGAILGPLAYLYTPQWSVLLSGLVGGTAAFVLHRMLKARHA